MDADGDEIMSGDAGGELANGEDTGLVLSEDTLQQIELRKGESHIPDTRGLCSDHALPGARRQKSAIRFCQGE